MKKLIVAAIIMMALAPAAAVALTFEDVTIEAWVGAGANKAVEVIDFGTKSFAFGYMWDGTATGWDMLHAIDQETAVVIGDDTTWGHLINSISYMGYSHTYDSQNYSPDSYWWEYWTSADGATWTSSWIGLQDRVLADGDWDGWGWSPPWPAPGNPPHTPTLPEPASLAMLGMGLTGLICASARRLFASKSGR